MLFDSRGVPVICILLSSPTFPLFLSEHALMLSDTRGVPVISILFSPPTFPLFFSEHAYVVWLSRGSSNLHSIFKPHALHYCDWFCLKELRHRLCILKKMTKLFKSVISKPFQSSPSSAIQMFLFSLESPPLWRFSFLPNHYFKVSQYFNLNLGH